MHGSWNISDPYIIGLLVCCALFGVVFGGVLFFNRKPKRLMILFIGLAVVVVLVGFAFPKPTESSHRLQIAGVDRAVVKVKDERLPFVSPNTTAYVQQHKHHKKKHCKVRLWYKDHGFWYRAMGAKIVGKPIQYGCLPKF